MWRTIPGGQRTWAFVTGMFRFMLSLFIPPSFSVTFAQGVHTLGRDGQGLVQGESVPKR